MTLPKPLRKALGVEKGGVVMISMADESVIIHPAVAYPIELYSDARIAEFDAAEADLNNQIVGKRS